MSTKIRNLKAHNYSQLCKVRRKFHLVRTLMLISILALLGVSVRLAVVQAKPDANYYVAYGEAWCNGNNIWTEDGNIWSVDNPMDREISEGARVRVLFSDNGTENNILDDIIIDYTEDMNNYAN